MFVVEYYEMENGKIPIYDFFESLNIKMRTKALASIGILEEEGTNLREPYSKHIDNGIFELRIKFSSDITRIFYFFYVDKKIVLTNGYIKKQQKMDKNEFGKAIKYKMDYERRFPK